VPNRIGLQANYLTSDIDIHSSRLPGGNFISALFNRQLMSFADRGGASGFVGDRWADYCDTVIQGWVGGLSDVPGAHGHSVRIDRIARLDAVPAIAHAASKRGLQNPDFIVIGELDGRPALQAADAKFSIETARSRQVSVEMLEALLVLRAQLTPATGEIHPHAVIVPGFFMTPDYPMTHQMLRRQRNGIRRATVHDEEVEQLSIGADAFFSPLEGASMMPLLARTDGLPLGLDESLMASLYYFRVSRALIGCWVESVRPLLYMGEKVTVDLDAVISETESRASAVDSVFRLMLDWDTDMERFRAMRAAVDQVTHVPIANRELREMVMAIATELGVAPPSLNQVRRRLGSWFRGSIRDDVGSLVPPVSDLPAVLKQLAALSAGLAPRIPGEIQRIFVELLIEEPVSDDLIEPPTMSATATELRPTP